MISMIGNVFKIGMLHIQTYKLYFVQFPKDNISNINIKTKTVMKTVNFHNNKITMNQNHLITTCIRNNRNSKGMKRRLTELKEEHSSSC